MGLRRELRAKDIMSTPVISVGPETPVHRIATVLAEQGIGGVPVVAEGRLVGVVNEIDLLHRHEIGTERVAADRSWVERLFRVDRAPSEYVKSHGLRAKDVMADAMASIPQDEPISAIALRFDSRTVRRLAVVREAELVGIVTRADVVRVLAQNSSALDESTAHGDEAIRRALEAELAGQRWWRPEWSTVTVTDGVVQFHGVIETEDEKDAARVAAENVPGVRRVEDRRLRYADPLISM